MYIANLLHVECDKSEKGSLDLSIAIILILILPLVSRIYSGHALLWTTALIYEPHTKSNYLHDSLWFS